MMVEVNQQINLGLADKEILRRLTKEKRSI